jgi:excisionase family DNA binding protein
VPTHGDPEQEDRPGTGPVAHPDVYVSTSEAARRLSVSAGRVSEWCRTGEIVATRSSTGDWMIADDELERFIRRHAEVHQGRAGLFMRAALGIAGCGTLVLIVLVVLYLLLFAFLGRPLGCGP